GYSPDCAVRLRGGEMPPPPPASPGTPPTARLRDAAPSPGFAGYSPDCAGERCRPPPPAPPGTPTTARVRDAPPPAVPGPPPAARGRDGPLPRLRGGEMPPPSPGFAGYSPDCAGERCRPLPRLRRVLPRLRGGEMP